MSKKQKIDIKMYASNLRGESVFFPIKNEQPQPDLAGEPREGKRQEEVIAQSALSEGEQEPEHSPRPTDQEKPQPASSTDQSTRLFTRQSTKQSTEQSDSDLVNRPRGFYITYRLDQRLNDAVQYLQEKHGIKKVDRSLLINALLDTDERWTDEALDTLVKPIISILTSRLLK